MLHFILGIPHAQLKGRLLFGSPSRKPLTQLVQAGRQDEKVQQTASHEFILTGSYLHGSLDINIQQHVNAPPEVFVHMALEGPIPAIMDAGMFKKLTPLNSRQKVLFLQEKIVDPISLTRPRFTRRA
jgi:hypothetical protein